MDIKDKEPNSDPVIQFKIHGRTFYVGQKVWSTASAGILSEGDPLEIVGAFKDETLLGRKVGSWETCILDPDLLSFEAPAPHVWVRGDWARHKDGLKAFVCGACRPHGPFAPQSLMVSFAGETITNFPASEFTFIGHAEEPE